MGTYIAMRGRIKLKSQYREWFIAQLNAEDAERWSDNPYGFKFWEEMQERGRHNMLPDAFTDVHAFDHEETKGRLSINGDVVEFGCSFSSGKEQLAFIALCLFVCDEWQIERDVWEVVGIDRDGILPIYYWSHQWFNAEQFQRWYEAYEPEHSIFMLTDFALYTHDNNDCERLKALDLIDLSPSAVDERACENMHEPEPEMCAEERERAPMLQRQARRTEHGGS